MKGKEKKWVGVYIPQTFLFNVISVRELIPLLPPSPQVREVGTEPRSSTDHCLMFLLSFFYLFGVLKTEASTFLRQSEHSAFTYNPASVLLFASVIKMGSLFAEAATFNSGAQAIPLPQPAST